MLTVLKRLKAMFDLTPESASTIHTIANVVVIVGAVVIFWTANIIGRHQSERISENRLKAAEAQERAAVLEKEAAEARLETQRLKQQLSWRRLSEEQARTITEGLSGLELEVIVQSIATDPESQTYAQDIKSAIAGAGIKVQYVPQVAFRRSPLIGILITGPSKDEIAKIATPLHAAGVEFRARMNKDPLTIEVGSKPFPSP